MVEIARSHHENLPTADLEEDDIVWLETMIDILNHIKPKISYPHQIREFWLKNSLKMISRKC